MADVVSARYWKVANLLLNPFGYPVRVAAKWRAARELASHPIAARATDRQQFERAAVSYVLCRWLCSPIHGPYSTHFAEPWCYGKRNWARAFDYPQFVRLSDAPLVCSTQFGLLRFRFPNTRR